MPPTSHAPGAEPQKGSSHFRAHARRPVRLNVVLRSERGGWERPGTIIDIHLAGAGVETDAPLIAGERVTVALMTPTLWDPLVLSASVAWAHPPRVTDEVDAFGRPRSVARAGLLFDYPSPDTTLAMFEMLVAIGFD